MDNQAEPEAKPMEAKSQAKSDKPRVPESVSWDAQEYVVRDKNGAWYTGLVIVGLALIALSIWLQWWTFAVLVAVSVVALIVYSVRPPRVIHYELNHECLREGEREYKFADFKAFGVMQEGAHFSIVLVPRKRFAPQVTVYFPEANGEAIVDLFGAHLPMEEIRLDVLDRVVKFLRI